MRFCGVQNVGKINVARSIQDHTRLFNKISRDISHLVYPQKLPYLLARSHWVFARTFTRVTSVSPLEISESE